MENIVINRKCILSPVKDCDWASEMVLNPSIIEDPKTKRIHMFFRAIGPCPQALVEGDLLVSYGAADERVCLLKIDYKKLMEKMNEL